MDLVFSWWCQISSIGLNGFLHCNLFLAILSDNKMDVHEEGPKWTVGRCWKYQDACWTVSFEWRQNRPATQTDFLVGFERTFQSLQIWVTNWTWDSQKIKQHYIFSGIASTLRVHYSWTHQVIFFWYAVALGHSSKPVMPQLWPPKCSLTRQLLAFSSKAAQAPTFQALMSFMVNMDIEICHIYS